MAEYKFRSTATSRHVILRHRRPRHPDMPSLVTGVYSEHMSSKLLDMESILNIDAYCVAFSQRAIIVNHIYDLLKAVQCSSIYTQQYTRGLVLRLSGCLLPRDPPPSRVQFGVSYIWVGLNVVVLSSYLHYCGCGMLHSAQIAH